MDETRHIKSLLEKCINSINSSKTVEEFLKNVNLTFKNEKETINESLKTVLSNNNEIQQSLGEVVKLFHELSVTMDEKYSQLLEEKVKPTSTKDNMDEQMELERLKLKEKYLENNEIVINILSDIKWLELAIDKITKTHSDIVSQIKIFEKALIEKEMKLEEERKAKEREEEAQRKLERQELEKAAQLALEMEKKQKEMEQMKKLLDEENKNAEVNATKFTSMRFDLVHGEFGENSLGCYVKTLAEARVTQSDIVVNLINPLTLNCDFVETDEMVGNIINISNSDDSELKPQFNQPFSVILPHTLPRSQAREVKIFQYNHEKSLWFAVDTQDVTVEDTDKSGARFVEGLFNELPLTVTPVSIPRNEEIDFGKKGYNWSASTDSRVNVLIPPNAVKINLTMNATTLIFDSTFTQDVKTKSKGTAVDNIYSFTHMLKIQAPKRRLLKPITISLPLPQKSVLKSETNSLPMTVFGINSESKGKVNFGSQADSGEEEIHLFSLDANRKWQENTKTEIEVDKKKDSIKFSLDEMSEAVFLGIRSKPDTLTDQLSRGISIIMDHFKLRQIKIIVTHHLEDENLAAVTACPIVKVEKQLRLLKEEGFDDKNIQISPEIEIQEREILSVRLRGNVKVVGENDDYAAKFMYCSQLKNKCVMRLEVIDKYAQRSKPKYQGFLSVTMSKWKKKAQPKVEGQQRKGPPQLVDVEEIVNLYEAVLEVTKSQNDAKVTKKENKEYHFVSKDSVTEDFIKSLSTKIKKDWKQLARALDLPENRVEEINLLSSDVQNTSHLAYMVLKLWVMHYPVSKNKELILKRALIKINREDILISM